MFFQKNIFKKFSKNKKFFQKLKKFQTIFSKHFQIVFQKNFENIFSNLFSKNFFRKLSKNFLEKDFQKINK